MSNENAKIKGEKKMKRIKLLVIVIIITLLFIGCGKTDPRLDGTYTIGTGDNYSEVTFNKNKFRDFSSYIIDGEKRIFEHDYKIKIIHTTDNGGSFYAIFSILPNNAFNDLSKRYVYSYTFDKNRLIIERESREKRIFIRK